MPYRSSQTCGTALPLQSRSASRRWLVGEPRLGQALMSVASRAHIARSQRFTHPAGRMYKNGLYSSTELRGVKRCSLADQL